VALLEFGLGISLFLTKIHVTIKRVATMTKQNKLLEIKKDNQ
jgi:hypothetical protein